MTQDVFTDHDPLYSTEYADPTQRHENFADVEMPKPKYANMAHQIQMSKLAVKLAASDEPLTYRPLPNESRSEYRLRIQAQSMAREIRQARDRTYGTFTDHKPNWHQKALNSTLISLRKKLRSAGLRDSKFYRFVSEQWFRNFNRIGGYKSKVEYRKVGDRSNKHEETKLARALDSWK